MPLVYNGAFGDTVWLWGLRKNMSGREEGSVAKEDEGVFINWVMDNVFIHL